MIGLGGWKDIGILRVLLGVVVKNYPAIRRLSELHVRSGTKTDVSSHC